MYRLPDLHVNTDQTFGNFICTEENAAAFGFATVVSLSYQAGRSPFLLCGPKNSGKTHLLNAIANQWWRFEPNGKLQFVDASAFLAPDSLAKNLVLVDLLLVDGLEAIAGNPVAQDLLRITCETLRIRNKQVVVAIETNTDELHGINAKLVQLFNKGVSAMCGSGAYPQSNQNVPHTPQTPFSNDV